MSYHLWPNRTARNFYTALMSGKLACYDEYDETRADFSRWKGIYETWLRRKEAYTNQIQQCDLAETLRIQPSRLGYGRRPSAYTPI